MTFAPNQRGFRRLAAGAVAAAALLSACGSEVDTATVVPESTNTVEQAAPDAGAYSTVGGGQIDLNDLQGQDTILWFWAPW